MTIGKFGYWIYDAITSMNKNKKNIFISIGTMIATMLIVAIAFIVVQNATYIINQKKDQVSKITAYLDVDVTDEQVAQIKKDVEKLDGVKNIEYTTKEEAIKWAKEKNPLLLKGYTDDVIEQFLPSYYTITFETVAAEKQIVSALRLMDGVGKNEEDVKVTESASQAIRKAKTVQVISVTLLILVIELSVLLIMNSTKLMLYAKRKEISIMKYVVATDGFIKVPFNIQGVIFALVALLITMIFIVIIYNFVADKMTDYTLLSSGEIMFKLTLILLAVGTGIGVIGSSVSMNKYLDV